MLAASLQMQSTYKPRVDRSSGDEVPRAVDSVSQSPDEAGIDLSSGDEVPRAVDSVSQSPDTSQQNHIAASVKEVADGDVEDDVVPASDIEDDDVYSPQIPLIESFARVDVPSLALDVFDYSSIDVHQDDVSGLCDTSQQNHISANVEGVAVDDDVEEDVEDGDVEEDAVDSDVEEDGEDDVERDAEDDEQECHITVYSKSTHGKGKDRKIPCFFCDLHVYHMLRHLRRKHSEEPQVASLQGSADEVRLGLQYVSNLGIYKHNSDVLRNGDGVLIVGRSPKRSRRADNFLPCQFCLQFFCEG